MHISLLSVQTNVPWFFMPTSFKKTVPQISTPGVTQKDMGYMDISSMSYSLDLLPGLHADLSEPSSRATTQPVDVSSPVHPLSIGPVPAILTKALVHIPQSFSTIPASPSTTLVHLLHTMASGKSSMPKLLSDHFKDIVDSFHDLEVLASARWGEVGKRLGLPIHIAALDTIMRRLPTFCEPSASSAS